MPYAIVSNETNEIINMYTFPINKETGEPYTAADVTTAPDVRLIEVKEGLKVGDLV